MNLQELISKIKSENIATLLSGESSHVKMYPSIRNEQLKNRNNSLSPRNSAVLILLYENNNSIKICLIRRTEDGFAHGGQVAFPGGKCEKEDVDIVQTALREAYEEVGVDVNKVEIVCTLTDLFIPPSNFIVTPVLGYMNSKPEFSINATEVQHIIECDLFDLLKEENLKITKMNLYETTFDVPYFDVNGNIVWGATAMILAELKDVLCKIMG